MAVNWKFQDEELVFSLSSPQHGWVAVGFNEVPGLTGTNLVMAAVDGKGAKLEDQTILRPGVHPAIAELGGKPAATLLSGREDASGTRVSFSIPRRPVSKYHKELQAGTKIYLLVAYSMEDDLAHHSIARTSFFIEL